MFAGQWRGQFDQSVRVEERRVGVAGQELRMA